MSFDYRQLAISRIISQYRNDEKLSNFITGFANLINNEFENNIDVRRVIYSIDNMNGAQLDLIGRLVVQPRPVILNAGDGFFGYEGTPNATGYNQEPYFDYDNASSSYEALPDFVYRRLLKSKALRNFCDHSYDSIVEVVQLLVGFDRVYVINLNNMSFRINFRETPDAYTQVLLNNYDVVPTPQGVRFDSWSVI